MSSINHRFRALLAGDIDCLARWVRSKRPDWMWWCVACTVVTCALYGGTFGLWHSGVQGCFTALKFPLVVLLTCGGNALLNGCLALAMGTGIGFRASALAILMSFAIAGLVLAALAPVMLFLWWNVPGPRDAGGETGKNLTLVLHVGVIAVAGIVGNQRLWHVLRRLTGSAGQAWTVLLAWLMGNLLLGSQISWILRPWIGSGDAPGFFSPNPLEGNFFEAVWGALRSLLHF